MIRPYYVMFVLSLAVLGCARTKPVIWETSDIPRTYKVLGPLSVQEEVSESGENAVQGLAGYLSQDGRVAKQLPPGMEDLIESKREQYKEMIFDKLSDKAREYDADAVIGVEYRYLPPYVSLSKKGIVTAKGQMVQYRG